MKSLLNHITESFSIIESTVNESFTKAEQDIAHYFADYDVKMTNKFSLKKMSEETGLPEDELEYWLANMEDEDVMIEIAKGDYDNFDENDSDLFNDAYRDIRSEIKQMRKKKK